MCFALQLLYMYTHDKTIVRTSQLIALVGKFRVHVVDLYQNCFSGADAHCIYFCWMIFLTLSGTLMVCLYDFIETRFAVLLSH